jgi:NAD(P)-dependent dehydrogenase (short-subunit alcohol dehydrogenase family)
MGTASRVALATLVAGGALAARDLWRRQPEEDLHGEVAVVTGGSRGLGFLLAREGCRVAVCARDTQELARAERLLTEEGLEIMPLTCDVSDRLQVGEMLSQVDAELGPVDVLLNNAGIIQVGPLAAMDEADFRRSLDIMFWGVVRPTLGVLPSMRRRRRGRIVNITSIGGKIAVPRLLPYCSAKFAAVGFSEGLRAELRGSGVLWSSPSCRALCGPALTFRPSSRATRTGSSPGSRSEPRSRSSRWTPSEPPGG